ncbi:MAG: FAD-dependent oxidoreductase [Pseudomonadota bacterium]
MNSTSNPSGEPTVVIIGGGHAGGSVAASLRQTGWDGQIVIFGDEPELPYQRPPLSKELLTGETEIDKLFLRKRSFYETGHIELRLNEKISKIDRETCSIVCESGERTPFTHLVIATGARPRELPNASKDEQGVFYLRNLDQARKLASALKLAKRLAVIGGGYIGLEVAASARKLGVDVVVVEAENRLLARVASAELAEFFLTKHQNLGVKSIVNAQMCELVRESGTLIGAKLSNGQILDCDALLIGIGAIPNDTLARDANLLCDNGIIVDEDARTSDTKIFAVGDCTRRPMSGLEGLHRIESVPNALEQAKQAAAAICGKPRPKPEVPWFWSNQFDMRLQIAGLPNGATQRVSRKLPNDGFAVYHLGNQGRLHAVEAVNCPAEFMTGRQFINSQVIVNSDALNSESLPLSKCVCA